MIKIVAIGKKHEAWIVDGLKTFQQRLQKPYDIEWVLLPYSAQNGLQARQEESQAILSRLKPDDYVILLDERGEQLASPKFSECLSNQFTRGGQISFVIGGAYGVDDTVHDRANSVLSLSKMVFPHQLVRLILVEQLYRAQAIATNHPYHHQ